MPRHETLKQIARLAPVRLLKMALTLLVIAFLAQFLLIMADRGRGGLPAAPETALVEAFSRTASYAFNHPDTYYLRKANLPATEIVLDAFSKSAGLLFFSLGLATLIGVPLGVTMALSRRNISRVLMLLTSVLLTSIPSFLLAMLLWIINIQAHQRLATPQLPITGFGWDMHIVLPALVLMARPLAQIAQVTYVTMQDVMRQDFVRVAYAKGFSRFSAVNRHALKNTAIPVMTAVGASLRFALASLPVVEAFFLWPGVGLLLLEAIRLGYNALVVDLVVLLGFLFLLLNLLLDFVYPLIDARLRETAERAGKDERPAWRHRLHDWAYATKDGWAVTVDRLRQVIHRKKSALPRLPRLRDSAAIRGEGGTTRSRSWMLRPMFRNGPLLIGLLLLIVMLLLVFWGNQLTINVPYQTHGVMMIDGKIAAPPFKPTEKFPWGSDVVGRDIQALVLWGARQTLLYREDFAEFVGFAMEMYTTIGFVRETFGENTGPVIGLAFGPTPDTAGRATPDKPGSDPYGLRRMSLDDKFVVIREAQLENLNTLLTGGTLVVVDNPRALQRKYLYRQERFSQAGAPVAYITPDVADQLLKTAGSSLADLDHKARELAVGAVALTNTGTDVHLNIAGQGREDDMCYNVVGFIPGTGAEMEQAEGAGLDNQVILISAYYDGLGVGPDGSFYPGANDSASGVAAMLEMARVLKESPYAPKKTIVFAAWSGGERNQEFSVTNVMSAKKGFGLLTVEAVLELSGMGTGTGDAIQLSAGSSYRLVQLFQAAAARLGNAVTTRGRDPHFGLPTQIGFGGRSGLTLNVSWDGSDATAHTPQDTADTIDLEKLRKSGQTTSLTLMVLSRETEY